MIEQFRQNNVNEIRGYMSELNSEIPRLQNRITENMSELQKSIAFFERGLALRLKTVNRKGRDDKTIIRDDRSASFLSQQITFIKSICEAQEECLSAMQGLAEDLKNMGNTETTR
jgi:hypothetical protein